MDENRKLFTSFPPVTPEQWIQQAIRDLKGAEFTEKLQYTTADGITVKPFYTAEDVAELGTLQPLFTHTDWEICETIEVKDEQESNRKALDALNQGATAIRFKLMYNAQITDLLQGISLPNVSLNFSVTGDALVFFQSLQTYLAVQSLTPEQLNISINADFIADVLVRGSSEYQFSRQMAQWSQLFSQAVPYRTLCISGDIYHNAGAPPAYQLSCILAQFNMYIVACLDAGLVPSSLADRIQITLAAGNDYFFEIAKFRALRMVCALLLETYEIRSAIHVHAVTAHRHLTIYDSYNNLLRTTTAAMAAVTGGCNALSVTPFDSVLAEDNAFSRRMARNIQLILKQESHFDKIADSAAGSWFIESITEQIAKKAWDGFQEIEEDGGFLSAIQTGKVQQAIEVFAQAEEAAFNRGEVILVGTNKFPDLTEKVQDKLKVSIVPEEPSDNQDAVRPLRMTRLAARQEQERLAGENS